MEEFDLLRIERFIFQVYDHFLSYWRTLGLLVTSPSTVIASLDAIETDDGDEDNGELKANVMQAADDSDDGKTVEKSDESAKSAVPDETAKSSMSDESAESDQTAESAETEKSEKKAKNPAGTKQEKWSGLLTKDLAARRRRKEQCSDDEKPKFRFEEKKDGRVAICLPVLFALFNVVIVTIVGMAMFPFIIDTFLHQELRSVDAEILSTSVLIVVIAFATAQFVDAYFTKRGHPSRPRQSLALCCYVSGYLVPYYIANLLGVIMANDVFVEYSWAVWVVFLFVFLCFLWSVVFWKRGLQHVYGAGTLAVIRVTFSSFLGALFIGLVMILLLDPTIVSNDWNLWRFREYIDQSRYTNAVKLGKSLLSQSIDKSDKRSLKDELLVAQCRLLADEEERLAKVAAILEKTLGGEKKNVNLGLLLEQALEQIQYHPDECVGTTFKFTYRTANKNDNKKSAKLVYAVPVYEAMRRPLKDLPTDLDSRIATLDQKLRTNIGKLVEKTEDRVFSVRRNAIIHYLGNTMQRWHRKEWGPSGAKELFKNIEMLYWAIQRERLRKLNWMKKFPSWLLANDYDEKIVLEYFE